MKYKVKSNIKHDGQEFKPGMEIELSATVAKPLLKDGIIVDMSSNAGEGEDVQTTAPQPPVNVVKRKGAGKGDKAAAEVNAEKIVEPGKVETPQPGDDDTTDDEADDLGAGNAGEGEDDSANL